MIGKPAETLATRNAILVITTLFVAAGADGVAAESGAPAGAFEKRESISAWAPGWKPVRREKRSFRRISRLREASPAFTLGVLTQEERRKAAANGKDRPLKIGIWREMPEMQRRNLTSELVWTTVAGGSSAVFSVASPGAKAMRLALAFSRQQQDVQFRFFEDQGRREVLGPLQPRRRRLRDAAAVNGRSERTAGKRVRKYRKLWSPVIEGDTAVVEIFLPAVLDPRDFELKVSGASHLLFSGKELAADTLPLKATSGSCNIDTACRETTPPRLRDAIARVVFTDRGDTFLCTGTLLRDRDLDSEIAYLSTANHCIDSQIVAETVETFWFFQRPACGSPDPAPIVRRSLGGDLLSTDPRRDFTLLQLNDELPPGVFYAKWSASPIQLGSQLITIHHPAGDVKKWSRGVATNFGDFLENNGTSGDYVRMVWSEGTTEPGSSGSALFDGDGRYRGLLSGGFASCSQQTAPDWYGRFDLALPQVERWLRKRPAVLTPFAPSTQSAAQQQWREFKVLVPKETTRLEVVMENLNGDADLFVRAGSRPNLQSFDCAPLAAGSKTERCSLENQGANTFYLGIYGRSSETASLRVEPKLLNENEADGIGVYLKPSKRILQRYVLAEAKVDRQFTLAIQGEQWTPISGDLNNDGFDSISVYDPTAGKFHLWATNQNGSAKTVVRFGPKGNRATPLLGDWDGDGDDTIGVYQSKRKIFALRNSNTGGTSDLRYRFSAALSDWVPLVGDWNADGIDEPGFYAPREGVFYLYQEAEKAAKLKRVRFGPIGRKLVPVVGDWIGNGQDTIGFYEPARRRFSLQYRNESGLADANIRLGPTGALPIVGRWRQ